MAVGSQISGFLRHFYGWIRSFWDLSHSLLLFVLSDLLSSLLVPLQSCSGMGLEGKQELSCNRGRAASWESICMTGLCNMGHAYTEWLGNFGSEFKLLREQGKFQSLKSLKTPWSIPLTFLFTIWHLSLDILYFHSKKLTWQVPVSEKQSRKEVCNLKHVVKIFILFFPWNSFEVFQSPPVPK